MDRTLGRVLQNSACPSRLISLTTLLVLFWRTNLTCDTATSTTTAYSDSFYNLSREDQMTMAQLRNGHCSLNHRLFTKFCIWYSLMCPCVANRMTVNHILETVLFAKTRDQRWLVYGVCFRHGVAKRQWPFYDICFRQGVAKRVSFVWRMFQTSCC